MYCIFSKGNTHSMDTPRHFRLVTYTALLLFLYFPDYWRIQGGQQGRMPLPRSNFFHFHAVIGKNPTKQ